MHHDSAHSLKRASFTIASVIFLAATARADSISVNYSTSMVISDIGVSGPQVLDYVGINGASVTSQATTTYGSVLDPAPGGSASLMPLGMIAITPTGGASGWSTTYDHTPFYLSLTVNSVDGDAHAANPSTFMVAGYLTGVLSGNGPSSLTATFERPDSISSKFPRGTIGSISSGGHDTFLSITDSSTGIGSPTGAPAGLALGAAITSEYAAPEPSSWAILGILGAAQVGALRLRSGRRRGRAA